MYSPFPLQSSTSSGVARRTDKGERKEVVSRGEKLKKQNKKSKNKRKVGWCIMYVLKRVNVKKNASKEGGKVCFFM